MFRSEFLAYLSFIATFQLVHNMVRVKTRFTINSDKDCRKFLYLSVQRSIGFLVTNTEAALDDQLVCDVTPRTGIAERLVLIVSTGRFQQLHYFIGFPCCMPFLIQYHLCCTMTLWCSAQMILGAQIIIYLNLFLNQAPTRHLPISCRSLVDLCGSHGSSKPEI